MQLSRLCATSPAGIKFRIQLSRLCEVQSFKKKPLESGYLCLNEKRQDIILPRFVTPWGGRTMRGPPRRAALDPQPVLREMPLQLYHCRQPSLPFGLAAEGTRVALPAIGSGRDDQQSSRAHSPERHPG